LSRPGRPACHLQPSWPGGRPTGGHAHVRGPRALDQLGAVRQVAPPRGQAVVPYQQGAVGAVPLLVSVAVYHGKRLAEDAARVVELVLASTTAWASPSWHSTQRPLRSRRIGVTVIHVVKEAAGRVAQANRPGRSGAARAGAGRHSSPHRHLPGQRAPEPT
jgi:hypothetical protein